MNAQKCLLAAATLSTGTTIDGWSRVGALAAFVALVFIPSHSLIFTAVLWLSLLVGLGQAFLAARTSLDASVFAQWNQRWQGKTGSVNDDLAAFDSALQDQLGKPTTPRTLDARIQAAMGLLRRQALAFATQLVLLALAIALHHWEIQP